MKKKVFFQLVDTLAMGGTERMSVNIAAAMMENGWESHLVVSRRAGGMERHLPDGVHVHYLNKKSFADIFAFFILIRLIGTYRPTVFHAHSTSIYWAVGLKIFVGRFLLVWHDHFGLSDQLDKYPRKDIVILAKWIDRIAVVNEKLEKYWKNLLPYRVDDIGFIGNFPWLKLVEAEKYERFTFLNLANLRPQKDQITLIKAAEILSRQQIDFRVLLVGEKVDEIWSKRVEDLIDSLQICHYVELVGPSPDVSTYLAKSHVGILSSESEGLPVALLEYGLAGLPVICTAVGDCPKILDHSELGMLVAKSCPEELALAMKKTIVDYCTLQTMGDNLREKVNKDFGKNNFLSCYFSLIRLSN